MFRKILIANRGEIACRVIRTAKRMGIKPPSRSIPRPTPRRCMCARPTRRWRSARRRRRELSEDRAHRRGVPTTGAEAVHPGYGFLSERPAFAEALAKAGIVFIGPTPQAIAAMGDKIESKKLAAAAGVSTVPGHLGVIENVDDAASIAEEHRLSGDDQGLGRRRRQGHAHRP
jgi:propionyl-CoA carboxylase alpha chain